MAGSEHSTYDAIMEELHSREAYLADVYAPLYICSYANHEFNLMNQTRQIYFVGKQLQNVRLHILFIAPRGYMKSYYGNVMAQDDFSIFKGTKTDVGAEQSLTEAGFVGTCATVNGLSLTTPGSAELNKNGLMFIDEFKGITEALKSQMNSQMETQLLAALDHGRVYKRLGSGAINYKTFLTLWTGVQPGSYDLNSGLGRRFCVQIFMPTRADNDALLDIMFKTQNLKPDMGQMRLLWDNIDTNVERMKKIERIDIDPSVNEYYHKLGMNSFDSTLFNRLIIGYHLMKDGPSPHMEVAINDKEIKALVDNQKKWRDQVYEGLDFLQITAILHAHLGEGGVCSCERSQIVAECAMIGWNAKQVYEKLGEMVKYQLITQKGNMVVLK